MKIKSIRKVEDTEQQCIYVSGPDHMYISDDMIPTSNTLVAGTLTELAWFKDAGWDDARIFKFFTDLQERIGNRMGGHYLGRVIIDSSPYSLESPIDDWIWNTAPQSRENYIINGSRWKHYPAEFPEYLIKNESGIYVPREEFGPAFQIFLGNEKEPPRVIENAIAASKYDPIDLIWCPSVQITPKGRKDFLDLAKTSTFTFLRNFAGIPTGTADRIFSDPSVIEAIFDNDLQNLYCSITAYAEEQPEGLIWNKIKDELFTEINGKYYFYRESALPRAVHVDQAYSGDAAAIAVMHTEYISVEQPDGTKELRTIYVVDFTVVVTPSSGHINLDALRYFITDLKEKGNMDIRYASFDSFQSVPAQQSLKRAGIGCDYITVDKDKGNENYIRLVDMVIHKRLKAGRNIHLKNNLKSLQITTESRKSGTIKYDHIKGPVIHKSEDMSWETCKIGVNAKDCLDAVCGAMALINHHEMIYQPMVEWRDARSQDSESINDMLKKKGLKLC